MKLGGDHGENWIADHMQWLDWNKMRWPNGARIAPEDRERVLGEVFKTLKTGGDFRIKPGEYRGVAGGGVTDHRFLIYKDAPSWLAMHDKYGDGSVFDVMMEHVDQMGRRIGTTKAFGPRPAVGLAQAIGNMRKVAADADLAAGSSRVGGAIRTTYRDEAQVAENFLKDAFEVKVRGLNSPENGSNAITAGLGGDTRQLIISAVLGSTALLQVPQDFFTAALRYRLSGLPMFRSLATYIKLVLPGNNQKELTRLLGRAGFINYAQTNLARSYTRLTGFEAEGHKGVQKFTDSFMRATGSEWHVASARFTTAAEFTGALADWKDLPFDKVPGKAIFEQHGITAADWDALRLTPLRDLKGHLFLMPDDHIHANGGSDTAYDVADKFMAMIHQEAKLATIEAQDTASLALKGRTRPDTIMGQITRSVAMFKNFPLTILNTHVAQTALMKTPAGKVAYLSSFLLGMTLTGAVGVILRDIAQGKDPQSLSLSDKNFWTRALLAGGGAGIVADLVGGVLSSDKSLGEIVAGPPLEMGTEIIKLANEAQKTIRGDPKSHFARSAVNFGARWMPAIAFGISVRRSAR